MLKNHSELVLHNIGTIAGNDVHALEAHLEHVAQELVVQK